MTAVISLWLLFYIGSVIGFADAQHWWTVPFIITSILVVLIEVLLYGSIMGKVEDWLRSLGWWQ